MADSLSILVLSPKFPYPPLDGGAVAILNMIKAFQQSGHKVSVLSMNTPKHHFDLRNLPDNIRGYADFHAVEVNTNVRLGDALATFLFSKDSYHVRRFDSTAFRNELEALLDREKFDVVQLETLFMTPYIDSIRAKGKGALIALRTHNVEHEIWTRRARNEKQPIKNYVFSETAMRMKRYEETTFSQNPYDVLIPISNRDRDAIGKLGAKVPTYTIEVGMDLENLWQEKVEMEYPSVFYLGSLDWEPNIEGLKWFLKEVWPKLHRRFPELPFYIAGRNMPGDIARLSKQNIRPLGEVDHAGEFMLSKGVMVAPIFSGSGMRVKIVEGMAYGKAIVA
ncbi:MAG: glycosyltransferase family 4 protein, partial [Bacteroidota bacterium]